MKTPRIVNAMEYIDEDMIAEAVAYRPKKNRIPTWTKWAVTAACFCLCIMGAFKIWNPGMGKMQAVHHIVAAQGNVYYSVWNKGAFRWNPSMRAPEKIADEGEFFETESGLVLYSASEDMLWRVSENKLAPVGNTGIRNTLDSPALIGIMNDYAYWVGNRLDLPKDTWGMAIVRTSLIDGQTETVENSTNGGIASCAIRKDQLYYRVFEEGSNAGVEKLYTRNLLTGEKTLLTEWTIGVDELPGQIYYTENHIIIVGDSNDGIYQMSYEGGEPEFLTDVVPITAAMDEKNGKIYFETAFGENVSDEFLSGNGYYSEELVAVDLETGERTGIADFELGNDDGTVRFTVTELEITDDGFYFVDPYSGLFFHCFADGTDTAIH